MGTKIKNKIISIIFEFFKENNILNKSHLKDIESIIENWNEELLILEIFQKQYGDKLEKVLKMCFDKDFFTELEYSELILSLEVLLSEKKEETKNIPINKKTEVKKEEVSEPKNTLNKNKIFTEEEIKNLISKWKNLYKSVPWNLVPKKDNFFYSEIQLKRFIDSWASDFIIETQKKEGKIYTMIKFKISWEHEIQDITNLAYITDKSKWNENPFFDTVRKYIWGSLWRINADSKHIVQDWSFSLSYRDRSRDFRLSSLPTRCYWTPFPRYCIRLTSEWDNIDFDKIELLPFMKEYYYNVIRNKKPWMIAFTGPTGSWKTTTIYWVLNALDKDKLWIWAIEKPIESQLHWINQTEEDSEERDDKKDRYANKGFLKAVLRQALDVIFVWEMRDSEETQQWVKTGLVGNKLITTFHTNSAVDTILRLKEEWVTNNAIGNWVKDITAQRLVQKICPKCSSVHSESEKYIKKISKSFNKSRIYCSTKMKELFNSLSSDELSNIDILEIKIQDNLLFLSKEDSSLMMENLEENFDKYLLINKKTDKIDYLLDLFKGFPNPELREWILNIISKPKLKMPNENGCDYEYEKDWNNFYCKKWYLTERIMIVEWLHIDKSIKRFIQDPDSKLIDLEKFLINKWFIDMRMYWYILALQWITTLEKIDEVVED